jgi:hypothetical protein
MFFNLLTLSVSDATPGCFFNLLTFSVHAWLVLYCVYVENAQSQKIEKHPGVTSGTLKVKRLKNILG